MINTSTHPVANRGPGGAARVRAGLTAGLVVIGLAGLAACKDTAVPNFRSPQVDPESPTGIQYLVTGVVSNSRTDIGQDIVSLSGFAREMGVYTSVDSRFITELMDSGTPSRTAISTVRGDGRPSSRTRETPRRSFRICPT